LRQAGLLTIGDEARRNMSVAQRARLERPDELKKLERARSLVVIDYEQRGQVDAASLPEKVRVILGTR